MCVLSLFFLFFFKQKTAYEMRISDWSSDVCSSDLRPVDRARRLQRRRAETESMRMGGGLTYHATERAVSRDGYVVHLRPMESRIFGVVFARQPAHTRPDPLHEALYGAQARCRSEIGRAWCGGRVWQ